MRVSGIAVFVALSACPVACGLDTFGVAGGSDTSTTASLGSSTSSPDPSTSTVDPTTAGPGESVGDATDPPADTSTGPGSTGDTSAAVESVCGDGVVDAEEACDDGNRDDSDACLNDCSENPCGDGVVAEGEACDDGDRDGGDSCSPTCTPVEILEVSVGADHTCALFAGGEVRCWGQNEYGALCTGKTEDLGDQPEELPVPDILLDEPVVQLASGAYHTCARLHTDNVVCWGRGAHGQLGGGTSPPAICDTLDESPPLEIVYTTSFTTIAAGGLHTCGIVTDETVRCWGTGLAGQLGNESAGTFNGPVVVADIAGAKQLVAGAQHTCALLDDNSVRCWGINIYGTLGIGTKINLGAKAGEMPPPPVLGLDVPVELLAAGAYHNCAIVAGGDVFCWGLNSFGQVGNGTFGANVGDELSDELKPVDLGAPATALGLGFHHSCALLDDGRVKCWGRGDLGSLGYGKPDHVRLPGEFAVLTGVPLGGEVDRLSSSGGHDDSQGHSTCAILLADRSMRCWGNNEYGQLGLGHRFNIGDDETPDDVDLAGPVPY